MPSGRAVDSSLYFSANASPRSPSVALTCCLDAQEALDLVGRQLADAGGSKAAVLRQLAIDVDDLADSRDTRRPSRHGVVTIGRAARHRKYDRAADEHPEQHEPTIRQPARNFFMAGC